MSDKTLVQKTLARPVLLAGIGVHTGKNVHLVFKPAESNTGIFFRRTDLPDTPLIPALYSAVLDTRLSTLIGNPNGATVSTIEHVMSALYALGVTNAIVEVDGPEMPIMDGSSLPFIQALEPHVIAQDAPLHFLKVLKPIRVGDGDVYATIEPDDANKLSIHFDIDFTAAVIGKQSFDLDASVGAEDIKSIISGARTFGAYSELDYLRSKGLALGASLENTIGVDGDRVLNPEGLRFKDEFVRHKILDVLGDLYTSGFHILGKFTGHKSSHALNNQLLRALCADPSNYQTIPATAMQTMKVHRYA